MGGNRFFLWGHWYPCLDFWWHLAWVSKPGWIPSLACCVACTQWNSQIHLWCDRCWPFGSQHGGRAILIHVLQALVRLDSGICHATASHYETRQAEALPTDLCWLGFHTDIFALVVLVLTVIAKNVPIFGGIANSNTIVKRPVWTDPKCCESCKFLWRHPNLSIVVVITNFTYPFHRYCAIQHSFVSLVNCITACVTSIYSQNTPHEQYDRNWIYWSELR